MFVNVIDMVQQDVELSEQPHIVVSTPGRLADHLRTGTNFSLTKIRYLVSLQLVYTLTFHLTCESGKLNYMYECCFS